MCDFQGPSLHHLTDSHKIVGGIEQFNSISSQLTAFHGRYANNRDRNIWQIVAEPEELILWSVNNQRVTVANTTTETFLMSSSSVSSASISVEDDDIHVVIVTNQNQVHYFQLDRKSLEKRDKFESSYSTQITILKALKVPGMMNILCSCVYSKNMMFELLGFDVDKWGVAAAITSSIADSFKHLNLAVRFF